MPQTITPTPHRLGWLIVSTLAFASVGLSMPNTGVAQPAASRFTPVVRVAQSASPAVVNIHGRKTVRADESQAGTGDNFKQVNGMGTGIIFDERGYVLTNHHVVEGVSRIQVTLADHRTLVARLIAHDHKTDLAVIKIDSETPLPTLRIGTSSDLMAGESVVAIGNAYGYYHTVTTGIISALHRTVQVSDEQTYRDVIQTSAEINPGNSGGPLLNIEGETIGVNVAVRIGAQGIAFAIPIDNALDVAAQLISSERVAGVSHGIAGTTQVADAKPKFIVTSVRKDNPAANQLLPGDVITSVGPTAIHRWLDFERSMIGRKPGDQVDVTVLRSGESVPLQLALTTAVNTAPRVNTLSDRTWEKLGMKFEAVPPQAVKAVNDRYNGGLKVTAVRNDSPAATQGIRAGDVLVGMHKWETISLENVAFILGSPEFATAQPVKFYILRGTETLYGHLRVSTASDR